MMTNTGPNHATNEPADNTDQMRPAWFGAACMATLATQLLKALFALPSLSLSWVDLI